MSGLLLLLLPLLHSFHLPPVIETRGIRGKERGEREGRKRGRETVEETDRDKSDQHCGRERRVREGDRGERG